MCGTMLYLAPEFFDYHELQKEIAYDKSVDIFALGLVFLALLETIKRHDLQIPTGIKKVLLLVQYIWIFVKTFQCIL